MNYIWLFMFVVGGTICAVVKGPNFLTQVTLDSAKDAITFAIGISGSIALWSGIMKIGEKAGLLDMVSRLLLPISSRLFPDVPKNSKAMSSISMSMGANLMGIGNAATPLGLEAMKELQELNDEKDTASPAMCTFLLITTSSLTLVPTSIISIRAQLGSANPGEIIAATIMATFCSTATAVLIDKVVRKACASRRTSSRHTKRRGYRR